MEIQCDYFISKFVRQYDVSVTYAKTESGTPLFDDRKQHAERLNLNVTTKPIEKNLTNRSASSSNKQNRRGMSDMNSMRLSIRARIGM
jgi:hypothetical protein